LIRTGKITYFGYGKMAIRVKEGSTQAKFKA